VRRSRIDALHQQCSAHMSLKDAVRSASERHARDALEAAFREAAPRTSAPATIVVKRRRLTQSTSGAPVDSPASLVSTVDARPSKVHRLRTAVFSEAVAEQTDEPVEGAPPLPAKAAHSRPPRKARRRSLSSGVTVVYVAPRDGLAATPASAAPEATARVEEPSELATFVGANGRQFAELKQRIEKLKAEANRLRLRERAGFIAWARGAICEYGISAADLGLRKARERR
jgi:hypothetical protein